MSRHFPAGIVGVFRRLPPQRRLACYAGALGLTIVSHWIDWNNAVPQLYLLCLSIVEDLYEIQTFTLATTFIANLNPTCSAGAGWACWLTLPLQLFNFPGVLRSFAVTVATAWNESGVLGKIFLPTSIVGTFIALLASAAKSGEIGIINIVFCAFFAPFFASIVALVLVVLAIVLFTIFGSLLGLILLFGALISGILWTLGFISDVEDTAKSLEGAVDAIAPPPSTKPRDPGTDMDNA
ncbi:hypothetical protein [Sinorhizobium fredii]|uniref:hypothetical protein n=1 Tax=Rhizobium fredii TaxID=380 RepID=UPI0004AFA7D9|nr:hypothetical protein [Sinorhizobium fredii]